MWSDEIMVNCDVICGRTKKRCGVPFTPSCEVKLIVVKTNLRQTLSATFHNKQTIIFHCVLVYSGYFLERIV